MGIKDLFKKYPEELRQHKYAVIEKLRERIGDDDRVVRKTLVGVFQIVFKPGCKEVIFVFFFVRMQWVKTWFCIKYINANERRLYLINLSWRNFWVINYTVFPHILL